MVLGVILSFMNDAFFGKMLDIWTVRVPQILLLVCIMGYMCILILIKWCTNWETARFLLCFILFYFLFSSHLILFDSRETPARFPPSLIQVMIDMVLNPFKDIPASQQLYRGQSIVQPLLVCIALLSIPTMLLAKPLYLFYQQKQANTARRSKGIFTFLLFPFLFFSFLFFSFLLFSFILFYFILFYFYFILFYFILFYFILFSHIIHHISCE